MENIPQLDLHRLFQEHREEFTSAIQRVIERTAFIGGEELTSFERSFAQWVGGDALTAAGCGNGTDAITLAVLALNLPPGSEAILPAMTYFATAEGLIHAGVGIRLVDVDPKTYVMDVSKVEKALTEKVRLIVPVHLYGQMAEMDRLRELADRHGCAILEDASQAHGARWKGKPVGHWGEIATYSFYPGKNLGAFGDAGAIVSRKAELIDRCLTFRNHGGKIKYQHEQIGYNSRLDNLQAAVLNVKMKYIDAWNQARQRVAQQYTESLSDVIGLTLPTRHREATHVYHQYVVLVEKRETFIGFLKERGIETGVHYPKALHQLPALSQFRGQVFTEAEKLAACAVSLPMCPTLTQESVRRVVSAVRAYFGK